MPGAPSRWNAGKDLSWEPLRPELVVEVAYDHMEGTRFRHTAQFKRWRPDREPASAARTRSSTGRCPSTSPRSWRADRVPRPGPGTGRAGQPGVTAISTRRSYCLPSGVVRPVGGGLQHDGLRRAEPDRGQA